MSTPRQLGMELLQDYADKLADQAQKYFGVSEAKAHDFALEAVTSLVEDWGGINLYLPMDMAGRRSARNAQIYKDFDGTNQAELALKYKLSTKCIYQVIKIEIERRRPRQASLLADVHA